MGQQLTTDLLVAELCLALGSGPAAWEISKGLRLLSDEALRSFSDEDSGNEEKEKTKGGETLDLFGEKSKEKASEDCVRVVPTKGQMDRRKEAVKLFCQEMEAGREKAEEFQGKAVRAFEEAGQGFEFSEANVETLCRIISGRRHKALADWIDDKLSRGVFSKGDYSEREKNKLRRSIQDAWWPLPTEASMIRLGKRKLFKNDPERQREIIEVVYEAVLCRCVLGIKAGRLEDEVASASSF